MDPIPLQCGQCGHGFTRAASGSGRVVHCPVCDAEVLIPRGAGDEPVSLNILRDGTVGGHAVLCMACRATMDPGDRVCGNCGAPRTPPADEAASEPQVHAPEPPLPFRRRSPALPRLAMVLAAAAVLSVFVWRAATRRSGVQTEVETQRGPDIEARFDEERARVRVAWDEAYPAAEPGSDVDLEHLTGRVIRGRIAGWRGNQGVFIRTAVGREFVAFESLRPLSRIRVDPAYREQQMEERARRIPDLPPSP